MVPDNWNLIRPFDQVSGALTTELSPLFYFVAVVVVVLFVY